MVILISNDNHYAFSGASLVQILFGDFFLK